MKAAQLTHGPFYNHFASKEALVAECLKETMDGQLERVRSAKRAKTALREILNEYLCREHRDSAGDGCVAAALAGDMARNPGAKVAFTQYMQDMLSALTEKLASAGVRQGDARAGAVHMLVGMLGAVMLARAVDDKAFSDEILARTHAYLLAVGRAHKSCPTAPAAHRRQKKAPRRRRS